MNFDKMSGRPVVRGPEVFSNQTITALRANTLFAVA
jgi:hypothetical protein